MTGIVERLRAHPGPNDSVTVQFRTMVAQRHEAADEIERLRAALQSIADYTPGKDTTALLLRGYARAALEPKP